MKKITTFIFLVLIVLFACKKNNTEPGNNEPNYITFKGAIGHHDNSTIVSSDNHLIICGKANYDGNWLLIKTTKSGEKVWRKDFLNEDIFQNGCSLAEAANGDLFVCGNTESNMDISGKDILLIKTNPQGDSLWTKTYGSQNDDYGKNIISTSDGNLLISGFSLNSDSIASTDIFLLKLETNGDTIWTRRFTAPRILLVFHLLETINGEYLITGSAAAAESFSDLYLLKVDVDGIKLWDSEIGFQSGKSGRSTIELSNEDLLISGDNIGGYGEPTQVLLVKTDKMGNPIWEREFGSDNISEVGTSIKQNLDGSYTITGYTDNPIVNVGPEIILLQIDQSGNQVWFKKFGGPGFDRGANLIKDTNDDNLITGNLSIGGDMNIFLTRTDKDGNFK